MVLNLEMISAFEKHLYKQERSQATIEKYIRDLKKLFCHLAGDLEISKEKMIRFKQELTERYKATSVNSILAAVNQFLEYEGLAECRVKQVRVQKMLFCQQEKELSILPQKIYLCNTVKEKYSLTGAGFQKDLDNVRKILQQNYPDYVDAYDIVMKGREQYFWNMFVTTKKIMNEYCEWLFGVLDRLEGLTDIDHYDQKQKRIYGYISERLLNVWVIKNRLKIHECPVVQSDQKLYKVIKTNLGIILKHRKY